jgi:diguanylate cyclase (GGDEF)-like protein
VQIVATLAGQGMIAYQKAVLFTQVERLATLDELTGVANRRNFFETAGGELARPAGQRPALAALMIDIDHFKAVNDTHGHQAGDEVIRAVAGRLRDLGREGDLLGRYGGEEFAVLMRVSRDDAQAAADRLRRAVADATVQTAAGPLTVTISVGLTLVRPDDRDLDAVLARADECLYRAKKSGRNRVCS